MKPYLNLLVFIILGSGLASASAGSGAEIKMDALYLPTGAMTMAAPPHIATKRSAVTFSHSGHFTYRCALCHHKWDFESRVRGCSASGCHDRPKPTSNAETAPLPTKKDRHFYQDAFHVRCRGCHMELAAKIKAREQGAGKKENPGKTGPTGCTSCHPK